MTSQWDNFLLNQGIWRGSFTNLSSLGQELDSTPSILSLEPDDQDRLVRFHLRRYGSGSYGSEPTREVRTDYRSLGRQVVFFDSGCFSKGSLQVAPNTSSGAEFGFIQGDRRFRLVQLFTDSGHFDGHVLIREFRAGSDAQERPPLQLEDLLGRWHGEASTISADWPVPDQASATLSVEQRPSAAGMITAIGSQLGSSPSEWLLSPSDGNHQWTVAAPIAGIFQCLADAGYSLIPQQISHRAAFVVEAGWMPAPDHLLRLIRSYDSRGAWISSTQMILSRL